MINYCENLQGKFNCYCKEVVDNKKITDREYSIVLIVDALINNDNNALKNAIILAKNSGVTNEEISYISGILIMKNGERIANISTENKCKESQRVCCS
ncbi:hypothetical protein SAMN02745163_00650 [Clostridium cavendishii DSM 21758]|uniref:Carboxymuconolactone decarboxylase family protein n=1 Tax=Clostridium cavendishii DSM 21758 TaxID=1121302 RepID=A0A1M6D725_9CLOT|nr:hypothetical protein [Clostridium cavendishii]SHI69022.1 hypothetical protein SAMN02745163_00650 [Clostridium cavendishii DSM 21758]